jgi:bisphosphoglycerate-dependent phosphoglycerate mutase
MINNIKIIKPLLKFETSDDFYYLQILQRKKENPEIGSNSRVIKNYYISSIEYLEEKYDEIKELCNIFNARAMLRLNKRNYERVAFKTMQNIANSMSNKEYSFIKKSYDRACGESHNDKDKKWILDIDKGESTKEDIEKALNFTVAWVRVAEISSKSGIHLITNPFRLDLFQKYCKEKDIKVEIHKDNPVNLYIP